MNLPANSTRLCRAEILALLLQIRRQHGTAILVISHDPTLFAGFADRIAVMYAGRIVEVGGSAEIFGRPLHPYTQALVRIAASSVVAGSRTRVRLPAIEGESPDPACIPSWLQVSAALFRTDGHLFTPLPARVRAGALATCELLQVWGVTCRLTGDYLLADLRSRHSEFAAGQRASQTIRPRRSVAETRARSRCKLRGL